MEDGEEVATLAIESAFLLSINPTLDGTHKNAVSLLILDSVLVCVEFIYIGYRLM